MKRPRAKPAEHPQGCRCFVCGLDREGLLSEAEALARQHGIELDQIGAGGRAPSPSVALARRAFAASLCASGKDGHGWSFNAAARLLGVDTTTVRYWLNVDKGAA